MDAPISRFLIRRVVGAATMAATVGAGVLVAQTAMVLPPSIAEFGRELGRITTVRELTDGRVLVIDATERRIVVVDFVKQRFEVVGRSGQGPGEYVRPIGLQPFRGDSTIVADGGSRRWLVLAGTTVVATLPPDDPAVAATFAGTRYADARGIVAGWGVEPPGPGVVDAGISDSGLIFFVARGRTRIDTIVRIGRTPQRFFGWTDATSGQTVFRASAAAFATSEDFLLFPDGWLAIVHLNPYRVDWRRPDGSWVRGQALPVAAIPMTEREKAYWLERNARAATLPPVIPPNAPPEIQAAIAASARRRFTEYPESVPPIQGMSSLPAPNGTIVIPRTPTADSRTARYDVVDRRGRLVGKLVLERGERIVGFGKSVVYIAAEDGDGLDHLRKHPWP